ncbi:MAG: hypothetical protein ACREI8_08515 [Myxococcota bacterium]
MRTTMRVLLWLAIASALGGCTGVPYRIPGVEVDPTRYEVLGEAEGKTTGIMLFNVIPIQQNDKIARAVDQAIRSKGGDRLADVTVQESWFWAYVLNGYRVHVKGTVLRERP